MQIEHLKDNFYLFKNDVYKAIFKSDSMQVAYILNDCIEECINDKYWVNKDYNTDITYISCMYLLFTLDCNLNCKYCTVKYSNINNSNCDMNFNVIDSSLNLLMQGDKSLHRDITLYGGEPLINKSGLEYAINKISEYKDLGYNISTTLITNGTLITDEFIDILKNNDIFTIVSIDGNACNHNVYRLYNDNISGSYDDTINGYKKLRDNNVRTGISLVMGNHNFGSICDIIKEFKDKLDIDSMGVTFPHVKPIVDDKINWESEGTSELIDALDTCCTLNLWLEQLMKKVKPLVNNEIMHHGCPSNNNGCKLRVLPNGDITLCESLGLQGKFNIGNVISTSNIEDIINNTDLIEWYNRTPFNFDECKSCYARGMCGGGCLYDAYLQKGTIHNYENRNCYLSKSIVIWYLDKLWSVIEDKSQPIIYPTKYDREKVIPSSYTDKK